MNVSILVVRQYLEVVSERGVPRERFLAAAGIEPARLDDPDGRLNIDELNRIQEAALAVTGNPALGIHMGERASAPAYDVIGHLGTHAPTLRDCIEGLIRFSRIVSDARPTLEERSDVATILFRFVGPPDSPPVRLRAEKAAVGCVRVLRAYCGESATPREALFQHASPPYRAEYTRFFGGLERFAQPITALRFDRALLSREAVHKNPRLSTILTTEAERIVARLERHVTCADRVRDLLMAQGAGDAASMAAAARRLGMSARSLRRRLASEGVTYPKIVEEMHVARAKRLLGELDRSVYQVAYELGFSDPSAFHRAFRRWTGMTPMQYRESLQ
jgi:AraC-like DNA-binding protein